MDLSFTDTQKMLVTEARQFLKSTWGTSMVRKLAEDTKDYSNDLWMAMAELGWMGIVFPQEYGGTGGNLIDLCALVEEMGRHLVPGPFCSSIGLVGLTLLKEADNETRSLMIPKLASGQITATLAVTEETGGLAPEDIETICVRKNDHYILNGIKLFVPDAQNVDYILIAARTGSKPTNISLFLAPTGSDGIDIRAHKTMSFDAQGELRLVNTQLPLSSLIGEFNNGWPLVDRALQLGTMLKCAEMLGGAEIILDKTIEHLQERVQFGRPIGTFQALQHHCANMAIDVEGCRYLTYQAAWSLSQGFNSRKEVSMAKAWVNEAYNRICTLSHQCHGAIGFTMEHDLQLYTRRARVQEQSFGETQFHVEILTKNIGSLRRGSL
jgi:alkylation response protein AidB-like acyl-CoA dehydrogenase